MFDEQPELSLNLATECVEATPRSTAARINQIAALINSGKFKLANAMASSIDEATLSSYEKSHFHFLRLKSAVGAGQPVEPAILQNPIALGDLYPAQVVWLDKHGLNSTSRSR